MHFKKDESQEIKNVYSSYRAGPQGGKATEQLDLTPRAVEKQITQLKAAGRLKRMFYAKSRYWDF